jgi:hypothetical protein
MVEQAVAGLSKLAQLNADSSTLASMQAEIAAAGTQAVPAEPEIVEEIALEDEPSLETPMAEVAVEIEPAPEPPSPPAPQHEDVLGGFVAELDASLGQDFTVETAPHAGPDDSEAIPELPAGEPVAVGHAAQESGALGEFVADLEDSLGEDFPEVPLALPQETHPVHRSQQMPVAERAEPIPVAASAPKVVASVPAAAAAAATSPFSYQPTPSRPAAAPPAPANFDLQAGINLTDMFDELKYELEEDSTATGDKDPETHYNLGVAFREMGLLDEAIGELQKVCQAADRGCKFPQIMQTYTWLAQCFLDKGVPEAAIRWYEKALQLPDLEGETRVALHYELASSYEAVQNKPAALQHFLEVYGSNIDYRDVAERIRALKS